jgi:glycosyltransferase involved in cell wall biosynthesis
MSRKFRVLAITRGNNRKAIEIELDKLDGPKPEFLFYDLPRPFLWLKKRGLGTSGYYVLWQIGARWHFRGELAGVDLIHHVTFNGVQFPGCWIATGKPVVLGPLGGGMTCPPPLLPLFGASEKKEKRRSLLISFLRFLPWWKSVISKAAMVIAANQETAAMLQAHRRSKVSVMLETAVDPGMIVRVTEVRGKTGPLRVLWLGQLLPRKAPVLAVRALAAALEKDTGIELVIAGAGPEENRLQLEVGRLGVSDHVRFVGRVPKSEVNVLMDSADAFLFTSIRDTSGNVILEAMSRSLPVVAIRHQGVREICDSGSSLLVEPGSIAETVDRLAEALIRLKNEAGLAARLGEAGRERLAHQLVWPIYRRQMEEIYQVVLNA